MSSFGSDLCPGEPCSRSLDHNFYPSDSEALPSVPFNTLESDCSEEPLFSLDPDFLTTGTSTSEESPCSQPLADGVQSPPPDAKSKKSATSLICSVTVSSAEEPGFITSSISPRGQDWRGVRHCEPESSSSSLLERYLTRKSRRVRAAPQAPTTLTDVCLLPKSSEQLLILPVSSNVVASTSTANVLADADNGTVVSATASRPAMPDCGNAVQEKFSSISWVLPLLQGQPEQEDTVGNSGGGLECEVDGVGCSLPVQDGPIPYADPTRMQQVATSDGSPNLRVSDVQSGLPKRKESVAKHKSGSVRNAKVHAGAEITQPREHVQSRENGWRCPRANKRPRTSRQSLLDSWIK